MTATAAGARSLRICLIGDSIAAGTGDTDGRGWHGRLAASALRRGSDLTIYGLGVRGDTSVDVARRWRAEVDARLPDLFPAGLVFQFGLNDCAFRSFADGRRERRVEPEASRRTVESVLTSAADERAVLMIGPAPVDGSRPGPQLVAGVIQRIDDRDIAELDEMMATVADDVGVPYLRVFDRLSSDPAWSNALREGDGIHPSGRGYEVLADLVAAWDPWRRLLSALEGGTTP